MQHFGFKKQHRSDAVHPHPLISEFVVHYSKDCDIGSRGGATIICVVILYISRPGVSLSIYLVEFFLSCCYLMLYNFYM